ncbi:Rv3654c family TadE-like protein [Streptomyces sp. NPDC094466]|uniref:Rv3654c family TadE-like protein n=1 Tax=Streptomyces sp. NPDC094466 TaxID=3366065 RepID=UPI0038075E92
MRGRETRAGGRGPDERRHREGLRRWGRGEREHEGMGGTGKEERKDRGVGWGMERGPDGGVGRRTDRIAPRIARRIARWISRWIAIQRAGLGADRGVATVWVAVTAAALCTVFAVVLALGQAVAARHRAGGAADLAALAAADRALEGVVVACETARRVAVAQGAVLLRCAVHGEIADVTARSGFGPYLPAVRARAGPPGDPGAGSPADPRARPAD